jgi:hypothetical protein
MSKILPTLPENIKKTLKNDSTHTKLKDRSVNMVDEQTRLRREDGLVFEKLKKTVQLLEIEKARLQDMRDIVKSRSVKNKI